MAVPETVRRTPRYAVETDCVVVSEDGLRLVGDEVRDLSYSGIQVGARGKARAGERVRVSLRIPSSNTWVEAEGVVARVLRGRRGDDRGPALGIQLTRMNGMSRVFLTSIARSYPQVAQSPLRKRDDYAGTVARIMV